MVELSCSAFIKPLRPLHALRRYILSSASHRDLLVSGDCSGFYSIGRVLAFILIVVTKYCNGISDNGSIASKYTGS